MKAHNIEVDHGTLHFGRFLLKPFRLHGRCCPAQPGEDQEEAGLVEDLRSSHGPWPLFVPEVAWWSHLGPDPGDLGPDPGGPLESRRPKRGVYDHDHHPFHFPEEEESFSEESCV